MEQSHPQLLTAAQHLESEPSTTQAIAPVNHPTNGSSFPAARWSKQQKKAEYPFNVRAPASELHITPGVSQHSLLSTGKYADANYITVFNKDTVNVYNANSQ
jgi:hypothetical protein